MRARNIKPGFFKSEIIAELPFQTRLLFIGLWCYADKDGRFEWRPKKIKAEIFPYDSRLDNGELTVMLRLLNDRGKIKHYLVDGVEYGWIPKFEKHQHPHHTEKGSELPEFKKEFEINGELTVKQPLNNGYNPSDSLIPDSLIPDSLIPDSLIGLKKENPLSPIGDPVAQKLKNLKISKEQVQEKIKIEYQKALPFLKEKYPGRDYDLELRTMLDWAVRKITIARKRVDGDLNLFFQNWMRKSHAAKPWGPTEPAQPKVFTLGNCSQCGEQGDLFGGLCSSCRGGANA